MHYYSEGFLYFSCLPKKADIGFTMLLMSKSFTFRNFDFECESPTTSGIFFGLASVIQTKKSYRFYHGLRSRGTLAIRQRINPWGVNLGGNLHLGQERTYKRRKMTYVIPNINLSYKHYTNSYYYTLLYVCQSGNGNESKILPVQWCNRAVKISCRWGSSQGSWDKPVTVQYHDTLHDSKSHGLCTREIYTWLSNSSSFCKVSLLLFQLVCALCVRCTMIYERKVSRTISNPDQLVAETRHVNPLFPIITIQSLALVSYWNMPSLIIHELNMQFIVPVRGRSTASCCYVLPQRIVALW